MSVIFADPGELHAIAERIARHADALRSNATTLATAIAAERWRGLASEVFEAQARSVLKDMWACARRLDEAADALRRHAERVHAALDVLTRVWDGVEGWGAVVRDVGGFLVGDGGVLDATMADVVALVAH